jgi:hypothetical protein
VKRGRFLFEHPSDQTELMLFLCLVGEKGEEVVQERQDARECHPRASRGVRRGTQGR